MAGGHAVDTRARAALCNGRAVRNPVDKLGAPWGRLAWGGQHDGTLLKEGVGDINRLIDKMAVELSLSPEDVEEVRMNRVIDLEVDGSNPAEVRERVAAMCRQLLANPVLEGFEVELQNGVLQIVFEDPSPAKFVISPNAPVRQIWVSALYRSYKLSWLPEASAFALDGETLNALIARKLDVWVLVIVGAAGSVAALVLGRQLAAAGIGEDVRAQGLDRAVVDAFQLPENCVDRFHREPIARRAR